jgi:hypothetical protein
VVHARFSISTAARAAWIAVRGVAPDLRGNVSEHDGGEIPISIPE